MLLPILPYLWLSPDLKASVVTSSSERVGGNGSWVILRMNTCNQKGRREQINLADADRRIGAVRLPPNLLVVL